MARLNVPTVAVVIGEGGSGGAVAIALADRVLMQENAIYSVISPEGCAAILWRDAGEKRKAAAAFKPDAAHCLELGVIDGIVPEPEGGAHENHDEAARLLGAAVGDALDELAGMKPQELRQGPAGEVPLDGRARLIAGLAELHFPQLPQAFPRSRIRLVTRRLHVLRPAMPASTDPRFGGEDCARRARAPDRSPFGLSPNLRNGYEFRRGLAEGLRAQALARRRRPSRSGRASAARRRSSSSSATTPAGSTTTSGSSATEFSSAGLSPRASRWSPARSTSPSTSRTTRSPTRRSRARSRRATTAPARSRSGTGGRTSSSRRSRTAA